MRISSREPSNSRVFPELFPIVKELEPVVGKLPIMNPLVVVALAPFTYGIQFLEESSVTATCCHVLRTMLLSLPKQLRFPPEALINKAKVSLGTPTPPVLGSYSEKAYPVAKSFSLSTILPLKLLPTLPKVLG